VTSPTASSPGPDGRPDPLAEYARLLERAASDPAVVGIVVFGSRAVAADLTPGSDVDADAPKGFDVDGADEAGSDDSGTDGGGHPRRRTL